MSHPGLVVRPWRGVSADSRRKQRRERLLEACLDQVGALGVAGVTVNGVCQAAGLTKRYFYESFADREAMLVAAFDDLVRRVHERMAAGLAARRDDGWTVAAMAEFAIRLVVQEVARDERQARLYQEAAADSAVSARRARAVDDFATLLLVHVPGLAGSGAAPDPLARAAAMVLVSGVTEVVGVWLGGEPDVPADELVAELVALVSGGLPAVLARRSPA